MATVVAKSLKHLKDRHIRSLGVRVYPTSTWGSDRGDRRPGQHESFRNGSLARTYRLAEDVETVAVPGPGSFLSSAAAAVSTLRSLSASDPFSITSPKARLASANGLYPPAAASVLTFSANPVNATDPSGTRAPVSGQSDGSDPESSEGNNKPGTKSLGFRIRTLVLDLEAVPIAALGLGLAGAIPFVGLTPGIASILPLPEALSSNHIDAQAAYGAVILTFLGGPHWGLAMTDYGGSQTSSLSKQAIRTIRYAWSVVPSLVAWSALLLSPVPKLALLVTSFGVVLGVDATFAKMRLIPRWYMPLRIILSGIAILSLSSSLIVAAAAKVIIQ